MARPKTQLFMLMSLDGKISTGNSDVLDVDKDFPKIKGVKDGLYQYYEIEKTTDIHSLNSGRVLAKIGMNDPKKDIIKTIVRFIVIDNSHLALTGVDNMLNRSKTLYLATSNPKHPAFERSNAENLEILYYKNKIDFTDLFEKLGSKYRVKRITIQTGGALNAEFLRQGLIDKISIVVAPVLIGGKDTSTLIDGESLHTIHDLQMIRALKLEKITQLKDSYIHLRYKVLND
jgi:2,5-diamino-6-(ribosylamino)-4(3H)-pyrimidinone 5'-phosphate reductase